MLSRRLKGVELSAFLFIAIWLACIGITIAQTNPQPPCEGARSNPEYAQPGKAPNVRVWNEGNPGKQWAPPVVHTAKVEEEVGQDQIVEDGSAGALTRAPACRKTPHIADPLSAAAASSLATSWADFTINTVGLGFRKGPVTTTRTNSSSTHIFIELPFELQLLTGL